MYPQVFGKYVLERELARGGMARVVLATLRGAGGFEKKLVVKQIRDELAFDNEWVRRFVEEAKTTVALSHPNIVPVYELGVEQGTYFLAMELVEGATVAELLKNGGPLGPEEGAYVGVEVCRALDYAHRRMDVVHRDVTPRNVMIDEEGQVKVIDFGIAAPSGVAAKGTTSQHEVFGSPGHMPPEQIAGASLGPAADIFAVAVTLMEAWSGKATFRRKTAAECLEAMRAPHPKPSQADIRLLPLDGVFERAMSLDPSARPQHAEELGKALRMFLAGTDAADVARAIGERVRAARAKSSEAVPDAEAGAKPRAPSLGEVGTRTFAARKEVGAWAKGKSDRPPKISLPTPATPVITIRTGTRRLPPSVPPPAVEPSDHPSAPAEAIETVATASLEQPVRTRPERSRALALVVAVTGAIAATAFALRTERPDPARPAPAPVALPATTSPPPPHRTRSAAPPLPSTSPSASAPPSPSPSASPSPSHLTLLADPGTHVMIDGSPRGTSPLREVPLDPGPHEVRFTFDPTGESRGTRVTLRPGERATVRADFSSATPTVRVER